jgi:hypothetical protein
MRAAALAAALVLLAGATACAQNDEGAIQPDRAGASTSTNIVPGGAVQIETGFSYGHERIGGAPTQKQFGLEAAVRIGISDNLEVGFTSMPFVRLRGDVDDTGHGDFTLNAKWRFLDSPTGSVWPDLAVLPSVTLPVTDEPFGTGKTTFGAILLASFDLPAEFSLDLDAGMFAVGQTRPSGYLLQAFVAAGLSRDIGGVTLFSDFVYTSRDTRESRDTITLDGGAIYRLTRTLAVDASVVTSLAGQAPDWTVRAGLSVRLGK